VSEWQPSERELVRRRDRRLENIRFLLDQWDAIWCPLNGPSGVRGDGGSLALLPTVAGHRSVRELERVLRLLFVAAPGDYRHLKAYRCDVEWRTTDRLRRRRRPRGHGFEIVQVRERERVLPRWLDMGRVYRAEDWLEAHFKGDPELPREMRDDHPPAVAA
jgi:hypothetical protein